jgi:hypothetical protein
VHDHVVTERPALRTEVWPSPGGLLHFPVLAGGAGELVDAVLAGIEAGSAVVVDRLDVRDALLSRGGTEARHLFAMRHDLRSLPGVAADGFELRRWQPSDAELLAPVLVAAYGPGHSDARTPDVLPRPPRSVT